MDAQLRHEWVRSRDLKQILLMHGVDNYRYGDGDDGAGDDDGAGVGVGDDVNDHLEHKRGR